MRVSKPVLFKDLPPEIATAVETFYTSIDAEVPENILWAWTKIPLARLIGEVWADPVLNEGHQSFSSYHRWWKKDDFDAPWPPKWTRTAPDSVYPVILTGPPGGPYDPEKGAIEDGWHRFHWYVDHWEPRKLIPVVWPVGFTK